MPSFIKRDWGEFKIRVWPNDTMRIFFYGLLRHEIIPYLWGADIIFDLKISTPKKFDNTEIIKYDWELCSKDEINTIKTGEGVFQFSNTKPPRKAKQTDIVRDNKTLFRQVQAINLGCISDTEHYKIKMRFTGKAGITNDQMIMVEFAIKDREDFYLQLLWILVGAAIAFIAGILGYMFGMQQ